MASIHGNVRSESGFPLGKRGNTVLFEAVFEQRSAYATNDNRNRTLQKALQNALTTADRVDIAVGFFCFRQCDFISSRGKISFTVKG